MLVRMENVVQAVLQHAEGEQPAVAERYRCEAAVDRFVRIDVEVAETPSAAPITDHCRRGNERGKYRIEDRQNGVMQTTRRFRIQARHPGTSTQLDHSHPVRIESSSRAAGHYA